ncbi:hypothetical protein ACFY0G_02285 [Streptomyces sp. NPDC001552]|uniref:hypothetical protein n=1 Tax=Streptomyces sp. NPDC001552 TaxID=3364587 RepID=UPI0036800317
MPSPNGYFDCAASSNISRNWFRARITHDTTSPPWDTPNAGSYEFEINVGTTALGPFTPAAITSPGNECTTEPDNLFSPNGVADSVFGVGGPAALLADTDYWLEVILRDPTDVEVDRFVCGPTHTEPYPVFTCIGPDVTQTTADVLMGSTTGTPNFAPPCNEDSVVWELATVSGGPYTAAPSEPVDGPSLEHTFTGLTPGTQYFARARLTEQAQTAGEYLVTQECPFITTAAPQPGGQSMFQPQPCGTGGTGEAGADVEQTLLCDVLPDGSIAGTALAVYEYDADGNPVGAPTFINPATGAAYVAQGTLQPCRQGCCPEPVVLCDVQPDNSTIQFLRSFTGDEAGNIDATDTLLDGTPYAPTGVVSDCDPYRLCTPSSDQDLNGDCGPGETPNTVLIGGEGDSSDSVIHDDPTADPLCGGVWDRPSEASPFTVLETFRNATFDQPGPVTQGSAPYAGLTASPGWTGSNVDAPGQGWLQTSDINSFTNGIWQVPAPFSTADGMTAQVTFASHDGTITPNGDGMAFVFTDGSIPPQTSAIGGGGGLGLDNWQGGYVAVVMDEYGGVCGANSICLSRAGGSAVPPGTGNGSFASMSVAPHDISADTGRANPGRLITSIISEGGQTYVSASILWDGDAEPTVYFDRFNVTAAGLPPAPPTLRMSLYGGSGGAFRSEHEYRDATATAAGSQQWRAFPIITDPVPPCVTSVRVEACLDVTFTEDTQTVGNGNPEAFLWLVNTATNTVLDKAQRSSQPSQVGTANELCVDATVPVAQLANLRVYVGAETRDTFGIYGSTWENLEITVAGLGCPVQPVRTLAISAPCPIDVNIVGGTADGTPAPVTVVNTPSTFEDALVCITSGGDTFSGFRREVRAADGTVTVSFLSTDGIPVVPDTWAAGQCAAGDTELLEVCDLGTDPPTPFVRRVTYDGNGLVVSSEDVDYTGVPYVPVGLAGRCDACAPLVLADVCVTSTDFPGLTLPAVAVRTCDGTMEFLNPSTGLPWPNATGPVICPPENAPWEEVFCDDGNANQPFRRIFTLTPLGSVVTFDEDLNGAPYVVVGDAVRCGADSEFTTVCDAGSSTTLLARYVFDAAGQITDTSYYTLDGTGPVVPVGPISEGGCCVPLSLGESCYDSGGGVIRRVVGERRCRPDGTPGFDLYFYDTQSGALVPAPAFVDCPESEDDPGRDVEQVVLCDNAGPFIRAYQYNDQSGLPSGLPSDFTLAGAPYVTVGPVVNCGASTTARDEEILVLCDATPTRFLRRYNYDASTGALIGIVNTTLDGSTPFVPVGAVGVCTTAIASDFDFLSTVLCDANGTQFIQRLTFNSSTGAVVSTTNTTLTGGAFVPVAPVSLCSNCCPSVIGEGCTNTGSGFYTAIRATNGTISLIDSVTGAAVLAANIVPCPSDDTARTLTAQARLVGDADAPWTPGADVVGTLTSVTMTVLSGTATLTDQNGTVLAGLPAGYTASWSVADDNTLTGPTSIDAIGGSTAVHWTQR